MIVWRGVSGVRHRWRDKENTSMIDRSLIGHAFPPHTQTLEAGRLRFFAKAVGETHAEYADRDASRLAAPPTFLFCLDMDRADPFDFLSLTGVKIERILHGEQCFTYHAPAHAGDRLRFESRIADIYDKRNGELEFLVIDTAVTRGGEPIADLRKVVVVKGEPA